MLVCAPTGTGKTNVALLAMLREIRQLVPDQDCLNSESPSVSFDPSEFKLVYLAPMKALATEIATSFAERLSSLRLIVREFTGDSQLSQREISKVHVLVMTPEKYDILTRKASEHSHALLVRLLVIDEVHLLHEERGCVLESIVARTLRQVELTQKMVRIVALSATLANYPDVATFLRVPRRACFHFGPEYRPVPMSQTFIGVKSRSSAEEKEIMNEICYQRAVESLKFGHQVMIFVQSRNDTVQTAYAILDMFASHSASNDNNPLDPQQQPASSHATSHLLDLQDSHPSFTRLRRALASSKFPCLSALFSRGVLFHHAGMPPADRHLVERAFLSGCVRLLVCTTTLAWGVNLPVHTVIIKGTQVYKPEKGAPDDLDTIDVLQIFGRAGRPQFDTSAEGILITSHSKLHNYVRLVCRLQPVESRLISRLADHLNAEVVLGTISNLQDAIQWLTYTYLAVRVAKNPLAYGVPWVQLIEDPSFLKARQEFVLHAAKTLDRCQMVRFDPITQQIHPTEFGRIASHYYIEHETMDLFRQALQASSSPDPSISLDPSVAPGDLKTSALPLKDNFIQHYKATPSSLEKLLNLVSFSSEFKNIRVRDQEIDELEEIYAHCPLSPFGGVAHSSSKVNLLIQVHICRIFVRSPSLHSDLAYISQSANRILRGLFEVALKSHIAQKSVDILVDALNLCKSFEQQVWITRHPLAQLANLIPASSLSVLEGKRYPISALREDSLSLISNLLLAQKPVSLRVQKAARTFPLMNLDAKLQPLTRTVFRLIVNFSVDFHWDKSVHGAVFHAWLLVHDICETTLYHQQLLSVHEQQRHHLPPITCTILLEDAIKLEQLVVRILSDRWLHSEAHMCINLSNLKLPDEHCPYTPLLPCEPLPLRALCRPKPWPVAQLYPSLSYLNPLQTQCFFVAYHTNRNLLVGAPTGSGKTLVAELATLRLFREAPHLKVVYIAPLKALVRERLVDWTNKFARILQPAKRVVELTGDYTPDSQALTLADVVVTTPEKWDGISRRWRQRPYVQKVGLLIIDEIHLLGEERGAVLEAIVSRTRFVSTLTNTPIRFLALSTAISNAYDLTSWLDIDPLLGLYNFKPSIRPVPCQVHLAGFPGRHYCPRMASMNRPTFKAIETYSPTKPALIFVSSRRQTRLTALDLISLCAQSDQPQRFLHLDDHALRQSVQAVQDEHLKHTLSYGIGLHHAGLTDDDKSLVEQLFRSGAIQVLVSTATLAWGINLPAHLVVIKGTEYFDAKTHSYIDYPVTDILQMIGRAGRPQFDTHGCAVVLVEASKKPFYAKFLYEAFPVESQLRSALHDHLNAEIVAGTVRTKQDAVEYLTWTFWFRRLLKNPNYYGLSDTSPDSLNRYLSDVVHQVCDELQRSRCISCSHTPTSDDSLSDDLNSFPPLPSSNLAKEDLLFDSPSCQHSLWPLFLGQIASHYYLSHSTVHLFSLRLTSNLSIRSILCLACCAKEYDELPVRHNEDVVIASNMLRRSRFRLSPSDFDSNLSSFHSDPHLKACLLVQFHLSRLPLPITDFITDTKQVFDQFTRILQAMIDVSAHSGWLLTTLKCMYILQMCVQACWLDQPPLSLLPGFLSPPIQQLLLKHHIRSPAQLLHAKHIVQTIKQHLSASDSNSLDAALGSWPVIHLRWSSSSLSPSPPLRYQLIVQIHRSHPKHPCHVYAPHFPKKKEDGWWLALSSSDKTQLLALKKITHINASPTCSRRRVYLDFETPQPVNLVHLLLISDTYVGLDQEYAVQLDAPSSQEASRHHSTCPTSTD
ncbi:uncharacterized protein LOC126317508 [Schistocerca gregaria]|uniref:uncharacterized protein LOC126317508 n=1 Tax=Schistocerca gregaria TaxID=7010 RepID=UPI00211E27A7|nr:uncharacterized protein LOC126317508 [Schistocerca gregaria]